MESQTKTCVYRQIFPRPADMQVHCMAYSYAQRKDGRHWGNYPICSDEVCPLKHEELLEGALLKTCHNCGQIGFTCGDCINRSEWIPKKEIHGAPT